MEDAISLSRALVYASHVEILKKIKAAGNMTEKARALRLFIRARIPFIARISSHLLGATS
jgi:hypothetical protein